MKDSNSFPDWFKKILIGIGVYSLLYIVSNYFAKHIPFIVLSYPIVLYFIMLSESNGAENWKENRAKHFTNISLSVIGFLTLIQLFKYDYYIKHAGKLIIGANEIFLTDNYYVRIAIYIFVLLFFIIVSGNLTFKTARRIESFDGIGAFQAGKKIWNDTALPVPKGQNLGPFGSPKYIEKQKKEALKLFDKAIEKGYDNAEVFSLRGSCLNDLGFYFDAIEDYNKAIERNPKRGIASNYHMRSLIKDTVFDYEGSLTDIEEAIRLSKLDNDDNEFWNDYAKKTLGYNTATQFYEWQQDIVKLRLGLEERQTIDRTTELMKIKRR
jgi:tetratricopeptide (TPR) repeat protein